MDNLELVTRAAITPDTDALSTYVPLPGLGVLPINAFVIRSKQPVIVDTGMVALGGAFLEQLRACVDLADVRWVWLTHTDPDHVGCLYELLAEAPRAKLVTTYLGLGKLGLRQPVSPERALLLNPGQRLDVGDRSLLALRPPTYDAPETTGLFDPSTRILFCVDTFGAALAEPSPSAGDIDPASLREGMIKWSTVDSPWLSIVEEKAFDAALDEVRRLNPAIVLGSHLPPATGMTETLLGYLAEARSAEPFIGPDQQALEALLRAA